MTSDQKQQHIFVRIKEAKLSKIIVSVIVCLTYLCVVFTTMIDTAISRIWGPFHVNKEEGISVWNWGVGVIGLIYTDKLTAI